MPAALPIAIGASAAGGVASSAIGANAAGDAADKQAAAAKYASDLQKQIFEEQRSDQQPWRQAGLSALYGQGGLFTRNDGGTGMAMTDPNANKAAWIQNYISQQRSQLGAAASSVPGAFGGGDIAKQFSSLPDSSFMDAANQAWDTTGSKETGNQSTVDMSKYQIDPSLTASFNPTDMESVDPGYDFRLAEGQKALERSAAARGGLISGATGKSLDRYSQDYASGEYQNAYNRFTNDQTNRYNKLASLSGMGQTANAQLGAAGQNYANQVGNLATSAASAQGAAGIAGANAIQGGIGAISGAGNTWMNATIANQYLKNNGGEGLW